MTFYMFKFNKFDPLSFKLCLSLSLDLIKYYSNTKHKKKSDYYSFRQIPSQRLLGHSFSFIIYLDSNYQTLMAPIKNKRLEQKCL